MRNVAVFDPGEVIAKRFVSKTAAKEMVKSRTYCWLTGKRAIRHIGDSERLMYADGAKLYPLQQEHPEMALIAAYRYPVLLAPKACNPSYA